MLSRIVPGERIRQRRMSHCVKRTGASIGLFFLRQTLRHGASGGAAAVQFSLRGGIGQGQVDKAPLPFVQGQKPFDPVEIGVRDHAVEKVDLVRPDARIMATQQAGKIVELGGQGRDLGMKCHGA